MVKIFAIYNQFLSLLLTLIYLIASYFLGAAIGEFLELPYFIFYLPFMLLITFSGNMAIVFELIADIIIILVYSIFLFIKNTDKFTTLYNLFVSYFSIIDEQFHSIFNIFINSLNTAFLIPAIAISFFFLALRYAFIIYRPSK